MKKLIWGFIGFILLLCAGLTLLITTQTGLTLAIGGINQFTGVQITAKNLKGTITGTLSASSLTVHTSGSNWALQNAVIKYNIFALTQWEINFSSIKAEKLSGSFHAAPKGTAGGSPPGIVIKHAEINQVTVRINANWQPIHATQVHWHGFISPKRINVVLNAHSINHALNSLNLSVNGTPKHYRLLLDAKSPNQHLLAIGSGTDKGMKFRIIPKYQQKSYIKGSVSLQWAQGPSWTANISAQQLNTSAFLNNGPLIQSLTLRTSGKTTNHTTQINWHLNTITSAGNLKSAGNMNGQQVDIQWDVNNANMNALLPQLKGILNSKGTYHNGNSKGSLSFKHAAWKPYRAQSCHAQWDGNITHKKIKHLLVDCTNVGFKKKKVSKLTLSAQENKDKKIALVFKLNSKEAWLSSLILRATLPNDWFPAKKGRLHTLSLTTANKKFTLKAPVIFSYNKHLSQTHPLCLTSKHSSLCIDNKQKKQHHRLTVKGHTFPIGAVLSAISQNPSLRIGLLGSFSAKLVTSPDKQTTGTFNLRSKNSHVIFNKLGIQTRIPLKTLIVSGTLNEQKLLITTNSQWGNDSHYQADINIKRPNTIGESWKGQTIDGHIKLHIKDASFFNSFSSLVSIKSGSLESNLTLKGSIDTPIITGESAFKNGKIKIIPAEISLSKITSLITADQHNLRFKLTGWTPTAPFELSGSSLYGKKDQPMKTQFHLSGKNLLAANTAEFSLNITPDLHGTITGTKLSVKGAIDIPSATIRPISFSTAKTLPSETVIMGEKKKNHWSTALHIKINLGKKVTISSEQLKAQLSGHLLILKTVTSTMVGNGNIHVRNGHFKAYGVDLTIANDSMLTYQEKPLSMPFIHAKAYRIINTNGFQASTVNRASKLTVGLEANGPYNNMAVTLYSTPTQLDQADILSYLVLGHPGTEGSMNFANLLATAGSITSSGLGSGIKKILSIKKTLGFTEFGVESNLTVDALGTPYGVNESGFVIGRYITPKIYVRYTRGISTLINLIQVQYLFNTHWSAQIESGTLDEKAVQGADIIYHFTHFRDSEK